MELVPKLHAVCGGGLKNKREYSKEPEQKTQPAVMGIWLKRNHFVQIYLVTYFFVFAENILKADIDFEVKLVKILAYLPQMGGLYDLSHCVSTILIYQGVHCCTNI